MVRGSFYIFVYEYEKDFKTLSPLKKVFRVMFVKFLIVCSVLNLEILNDNIYPCLSNLECSMNFFENSPAVENNKI